MAKQKKTSSTVSKTAKSTPKDKKKKLKSKVYEVELAKLQIELVKLQEWIKQEGLKVVVLFEGRDAAGKGVLSSESLKASIRGCAG